MALVHRCDICRDESPDATSLTTVVGRMNLLTLAVAPAADAPANYVLVSLDLCAKPSCRKIGLSQMTEELFLRSVELAGLSDTKVALSRKGA